jgi:signal peptidase I
MQRAPIPQDPPGKESIASTWDTVKRWTKEIVGTLVPALFIALVVNVYVAEARIVEGPSMEPNLLGAQRLIIDKASYRFHKIERGDIVMIDLPQRAGPPLIKRAVGLPGETVAIHNGQVFIDGALLSEPYLSQLTYSSRERAEVPQDSLFVLGDNRACSSDSRSFGPVDLEWVMGRAWFRYWPPSDVGFFK